MNDHYSTSLINSINKLNNEHDNKDAFDPHDKNEDISNFRYIRHHLLDNFDDVNSYDGPVRQFSSFFNRHGHYQQQLGPNAMTGLQQKGKLIGNWLPNSVRASSLSLGSLFRMNAEQLSHSNKSTLLFGAGGLKAKTTLTFSDNNSQLDNTTTTNKQINDNSGQSSENNLLSATIVVGCSLLALNLLVFAGVYYNLQKRSDSNVSQNSANNANANYDLKEESQVIYCSSSPKNKKSQQILENNGAEFMGDVNSMGMILNEPYYGSNDTATIETIGPATSATQEQSTPTSHVIHHVHYADQTQTRSGSCEQQELLPASRTNTQHHLHGHHHNHHLIIENDADSHVEGDIDEISSMMMLGQNNHHAQSENYHNHSSTLPQIAQYFPLHNFPTNNTSNKYTKAAATDADLVIHQQHLSGRSGNRIRFSLSSASNTTDSISTMKNSSNNNNMTISTDVVLSSGCQNHFVTAADIADQHHVQQQLSSIRRVKI